MKIGLSRTPNPLADGPVESGQELKYVLVENCMEEEIEWVAQARFSDKPNEAKTVTYHWEVGETILMEEDYARAVFGIWDLMIIYKDEPDQYMKEYNRMMQRQLTMWPSPSPPHVKIYEKGSKGKRGRLLLDTWEQYDKWMKEHGREHLPRRTQMPKGGVVPAMPDELRQMDRAGLLKFADNVGFRIPPDVDWDTTTIRELCFTFASQEMINQAITKTMNQIAASERKSTKKSG